MKSTFLIITSFILIELVPISILFFSKGNIKSVSTHQNIVHTSTNCEVSSFNVNNSNYADGKIYCVKIFKNKMNFEVTKNPSDFVTWILIFMSIFLIWADSSCYL
jgi:hypothetical protein